MEDRSLLDELVLELEEQVDGQGSVGRLEPLQQARVDEELSEGKWREECKIKTKHQY